MNVSKFVKDFIADALLGVAAAIAALQFAPVTFSDVQAQYAVLSFAVVKALVQAVYRAVLRWATAPEA